MQMNMRGFWFVNLVAALLATGCQANREAGGGKVDDVIDRHGRVENRERWEQFYANVTGQQEDAVRLVRYTIEGDPIYYTLRYDGKMTIQLHYDNRKDKYGSPNVRDVSCTAMTRTEVERGTRYQLSGCTGKNETFGNNFTYELPPATEGDGKK